VYLPEVDPVTRAEYLLAAVTPVISGDEFQVR
jgi:hypothetical protein